MSWILPSALGIGAVAIAALVAVHFIARSRPLAEPLPTARFVPARSIRQRTRSYALSDLVLLVMRALALIAICAAVAAPVLTSSSGRVARIIIVDRSRDVGNVREVRDSVRSIARPGDALVLMDSAAVRVASLSIPLRQSEARGSLSAALVEGARVAVALSRRVDSLDLVVVSPLANEEIDHATPRIRSTWPGRVRLVRVAAAPSANAAPQAQVSAAPNDAVAAGLALAGFMNNDGNVRVVRGKLARADSAWARAKNHVVVHWPASADDADWPTRRSIDASGAVVSSTGVLVARLPRLWALAGHPIAHWADGETAAIEQPAGAGCIRHVGVLIDASSDVALQQPFRDFVRALLAPCGGEPRTAIADAATLASLGGGTSLAPAALFHDTSVQSSRWTPWLLAIGALLLIAEMVVRRGASKPL